MNSELFVKIICVQSSLEHKNGVDIMAIIMDTQRTGFFQELPQDLRRSYLGLTRNKSVHMIDNLYYTVFVRGDSKESFPGNMEQLLAELEEHKTTIRKTREPIEYSHGLYCVLKKYSSYSYCLSQPDLYDIFFLKSLTNDDTPRIIVQLRAFGLWTKSMDAMLTESFDKVQVILAEFDCTVDWCRESRIDYCYHTNSISSPNKLLKEDSKGKIKNLHTNLHDAKHHAKLEHVEDGTIFHKDYICFGNVESNNVRARVYDKVKEVIEMGYKNFFFKIWHDNGLISYYDKWCIEYAFPYKSMDYLAKARLAFYVEHGADSNRCYRYHTALSSEKTTMAVFKRLADEFMPKVTTVLNIEYETKRKFYYYSDHIIDGFRLTEARGEISTPLQRIYKILDYRSLFLDYLTGKTLSFHKGGKYLQWWERLRNTKHEGKRVDGKLLRDYSYKMDKVAVQKRAIKAIASLAVYDDKLETGFVEDFTDMLSDISDNKAHVGFRLVTENGEIVETVYGSLVGDYMTEKAKKEMTLKNRKKRRAEKQAELDEWAAIATEVTDLDRT